MCEKDGCSLNGKVTDLYEGQAEIFVLDSYLGICTGSDTVQQI